MWFRQFLVNEEAVLMDGGVRRGPGSNGRRSASTGSDAFGDLAFTIKSEASGRIRA
jgi:hypothetical protein